MPSIHQVNHPGREQNISYRVRENHKGDYEFYESSSPLICTTTFTYDPNRTSNGYHRSTTVACVINNSYYLA